MGRVVIEVTIENLEDLWAVRRGSLPAEHVRRVVVAAGSLTVGSGCGGLDVSTKIGNRTTNSLP